MTSYQMQSSEQSNRKVAWPIYIILVMLYNVWVGLGLGLGLHILHSLLIVSDTHIVSVYSLL